MRRWVWLAASVLLVAGTVPAVPAAAASVPHRSRSAQAAAPLTFVTTTLPDGFVGTAYSSTLRASGGTSPYSWRIVAGGLPDGLTLSPAGVISGTPTRVGKWSVTPAVTDADGTQVSHVLSLRIPPPIDTTPAMRCPGAVFDTTTDCTLTVTDNAAGPAPTGTIQYQNGRTFFGSCDLAAPATPGADRSSCTVSITWDGEGRFTAGLTYFGDAAHNASQGNARFTVAPQTGGIDTDAVIRCPGATDFADAKCVLTVTNRPKSATPAPTGYVEFAYLNDEGEGAGSGCTLVARTGFRSRCSLVYSFDEVPSQVVINYHGDAQHHASLFLVPLNT